MKEEIALRSVKQLCSELPSKAIGHLPPPVIIRRKQILICPERGGGGFLKGESSESHDSSIKSHLQKPLSLNKEFELTDCPKLRPIVKSWSSNGTPKFFIESDINCQEFLKSSKTNASSSIFIDRISLSSYCLENSEIANEERNILIEEKSTRSTTSLRRSKFNRFGGRRTNGSFASLKDQSCSFDVPWRNGFSPKVSFESDTVSEIQEEEEEEEDYFDDRPSTSTAITFRKRLACWSKEGKDLLVKSVNSANTLAPTTMTCIKSPRAMSEHLLGQFEGPGTTQSMMIGALKCKGGGSFRDGDRGDGNSHRQKWSSVRIKGGSTKSLLLENGGPQSTQIKGQITKEVFIKG